MGQMTIGVNTSGGMYAHNPGPNSKSSLQGSGRGTPAVGLLYPLTIGAADYQISLYAMQSGTVQHTLQLQAGYTCLNDGSNVYTDTLAIQYAQPLTWTPLTSTYAFPPHRAPKAGCKLTSAALQVTQGDGSGLSCGTQVECPDLFVDDVSITLTNYPAQL